MELIDKERVEKILRNLWKEDDGTNSEHRICYNKALQEVQYELDNIEVKDVDLEKEIDKWWCSLYTDYSMMRVPNHKFVPVPAYIDSNFKQSVTGKTKIAFELWTDWKVDSNDIEWDPDTVRNFAKYFYELGLKANKE